MHSRCKNPKDNNYPNYGAKGITVCKRWDKFENFYADMGELPFYEAQLDRIDNTKGYSPENCRWVTAKENCRNKSNNKKYISGDEKLVQAALIEKIGWSKNQFRWFKKRYGIAWILENFKTGTLPEKTNEPIDRTDLQGQKFGKWLVLKFDHYTKKEGHLYLSQCECGKERLIPRNNLIREKTKMCRQCSAKDFWAKRKNAL